MAVREGRSAKWNTWEEPLVSGSMAGSTTLESAPPALIFGAAETSQAGAFYWFTKRCCDVILSASGLLALLPVMTFVALGIRLSSRGPIFFKQTRIGRNGIPFAFYKFRSMVVGSEERKHALLHRNQAEYPLFKMRDDPRVTRFGRVIRRLGIDELPQLWNVLRGDMSLVGPRPHLPEEVREYRPRHWTRLEVTPGITCLWQVRARKELSFNEWIESDLEYVKRQSMWLDCVVLARTLLVLCSSERIS